MIILITHIIISLIDIILVLIITKEEINKYDNEITVGEVSVLIFACMLPIVNLIILFVFITSMEIWKTPINNFFKK